MKINATRYEDIPTYPNGKKGADRHVHAIVETPKGSPHKYALKSGFGILSFHDVLPDGMEWPFDYGFVPQTLADDGDPLDILVLVERALFSGCLIEARVIGAVLETKDGVENDRVIAVPLPSPGAPKSTDACDDVADLPRPVFDGIERFLHDYSQRQGHAIETKAIVGADDAMKLVRTARKGFKKRAAR
ncbi:MAG: inorganic diphosphatase [Vulcanimicrobiaceae bacterium]